MKFLSGTRARRITYTVVPSRPVMDLATGRSDLTPAIRAKFVEHRFDSEAAAVEEGWDEFDRQGKQEPGTTRKRVEEYLMHHKDFGRSDGRGIFLDSTTTLTELELRARGMRRRCIFMQDAGDTTVQCGEFVEDPEADYCPPHEAVVQAAITGRNVPAPSVSQGDTGLVGAGVGGEPTPDPNSESWT